MHYSIQIEAVFTKTELNNDSLIFFKIALLVFTILHLIFLLIKIPFEIQYDVKTVSLIIFNVF